MNIRIAKDERDSRSASYIYAMSWKSAYKGILSEKVLEDIPLDRWVDAFNGNYQTRRFEVAIMNIDGEDIGAGAYGLSRDYHDPAIGEITSMYFLDAVWGKGYAESLMHFMLGRLKETGCSKVHVWVLKDNRRAQRFYEKCGFQKTQNAKATFIKDEENIIVEYIKDNI